MSLTYNITPDAEGRGAWTQRGGLLPVSPTSTNRRVGYYRLNAKGEAPVGSAWLSGADTSDAARCVNLGTKSLQRLCGVPAPGWDGWYGPQTDTYVRSAQARHGIDVDGIAGRATLRALLEPLIRATATDFSIPFWALGGIAAKETALDPGAVGATTPYDHGLVQINLSPTAHGATVALEQAMDPYFALPWAAQDVQAVHRRWNGRTVGGADPWDVAVLHHNSPLNARKLATTGAWPTAQSRRYVHGGTFIDSAGRTVTEVGVRGAWEALT